MPTDRALLRADHYAPERMETPKPLLEVLKRKLAAQEPLSRPDYVAPVSPNAAPVADPIPERTPKAALPTEPTVIAPPNPQPVEVPAVAEKPAPPPAPLPEPMPAPEPGTATTPALEPEPFAAPVPAEKPESLPEPVIAPTAKAVSAPASSPRPKADSAAKPAVARSLRVQVATFSAGDRANKAAARLGGNVTRSGNFWLMRLGPFATQAEAKAALAKAKAAGYSDARILRAD